MNRSRTSCPRPASGEAGGRTTARSSMASSGCYTPGRSGGSCPSGTASSPPSTTGSRGGGGTAPSTASRSGSPPSEFANATVQFSGGQVTRVVATHRRCWGRAEVFYDPVHYPAVLERKPGALDFAAPLEGWELPVCFGVLRRRLEAEFGSPGTRQYIKVLRLLEWAGLDELSRAVERALELGTADADAVRLILEHRREQPVGLFCLDG